MIAVVIPAYKAKSQILDVIAQIGEQVAAIYVVDDACPDSTGKHVETQCDDARVNVIYNTENLGVGGAMIAGYRQAMSDGAEIIVKLDSDGQMDPRLIGNFVRPIIDGKADYTKGNRFFDIESVQSMPKLRLLGNATLSFLTKFSSGYWNIMDPTNGFTAIHANVLKLLPLDKLDRGYFFESDLLFRLNTVHALVMDIPMTAKYGGENSHLFPRKIAFEFFVKHVKRSLKRLFYNYFLRDFNVGTLFLISGTTLTLFGLSFGLYHWWVSINTGQPATSGTVMLAAIPGLLGIQSLISALSYDIANVPRHAIHSFVMDARDSE